MSDDTDGSAIKGPMQYLTPELAKLAATATGLRHADIEASTRQTYTYYLNAYDAFCAEHGLDPDLPPTIELYIADRFNAQESPATLLGRIAAIRRRAREMQRPDPTEAEGARALRRNAARKLARPKRRASPATVELLPALAAAALDAHDPHQRGIGLRDRALVLLGFALGRRGSELARVDVEHITRETDGILVSIPSSKTNKSGEPEVIGVPTFPGHSYCPVAALDAWLDHAMIGSGPVFIALSDKSKPRARMSRVDIARRLATIAERANLHGFWASHSLRRGVVTSAEQRSIARTRTLMLTGWKDETMFPTYADHRDKISHSPLHEIYNQRAGAPKLIE